MEDLNPETARLCDDQLRPGVRCLLPRGHAGDHECVAPNEPREPRTSPLRAFVSWK